MTRVSYGPLSTSYAADLEKLHTSLFHRPLSQKAFESYLSTVGYKKSLSFGAFLDDNLIAFLVANSIQGECEILTLGVLKENQNQGVALELFKLLLGSPDVKTIFLEVNVNNRAAISLYKKIGFQKVSIRQKYYKTDTGILENAFIFKYS